MDAKEKKKKALTATIFDLLATDIHNKNKFSESFVKKSIANAIFQQGPKYYSGLISVKARDALETGEITRHKLCKEHPYPRTRTANDIINYFDNSFGKKSNNSIISNMENILERGCKIHYTLSSENMALYPHQQNYNLSEEEIYSLAGVELVEDNLTLFPYTYKYQNIEYNSIPEIVEKLGFTKYRVNKMISNGEIEKRENK